MKICLDAGHYGKYNQSPVNPDYWESDFAWKFHLFLKIELEKRGITVTTTRTVQSKDLDLVKRGQLAKDCDLFLSIHSNACADSSADYPLACCCVNGQADVLGHELAEAVAKVMQTTGKARIWKRQGSGGSDYYGVLRGAAAVGTPGILLEHGFHTNLRDTNWLMNDENLRRMAAAEAETIAAHYDVNSTDTTGKKTETASSTVKNATDSTAKHIWNKLRAAGLSEAGAAGLMGNLKAESNLQPNNLQNSFEKKLGFTDVTYTAAVDDETYTNFANDSAGYGLAQWTYRTRKAALFAFAKAQRRSIGDLDLQIDFILRELLNSYPVLFGDLRTATDVRAASDSVLVKYERPADMSEEVKVKRAGFGEEFLREFGGKSAEDPASYADALQGVLEIGGKRYEVTLIEV
jgi:N-acetylmuramoyl-L-alanine amidase